MKDVVFISLDGFATQKVYQTGALKNHLPDHTLGTSP